jgi:hypothetical protein
MHGAHLHLNWALSYLVLILFIVLPSAHLHSIWAASQIWTLSESYFSSYLVRICIQAVLRHKSDLCRNQNPPHTSRTDSKQILTIKEYV